MFSFINGNYSSIGGNYKPDVNTVEGFFADNTAPEVSDAQYLVHEEEMDNLMKNLKSIYEETKNVHTVVPVSTPKVMVASIPTIETENLNSKIDKAEENRNQFLEENKIKAEQILEDNRKKQAIKDQEMKERRIAQEIQKQKIEDEREKIRTTNLQKKNLLLSEAEEKSRRAIEENIAKQEYIQNEINDKNRKMSESLDYNINKVQLQGKKMGEYLEKTFGENITELSDDVESKLSDYDLVIQRMQEKLNNLD